MDDPLENFAKTILEDEECFESLCKLVKTMMEFADIRDEIGGKLLRKIYNIEE